ncbi:hypothetical protein E4U42_002159 [Claviceps africana]|uniref:Glycosyltransferase 2 n=1 Tax=Claviceps africana TaxID=83212 RepID=A0A8K0JEL5_9HYPO|nr:hypothetical protein E4U42_002159 [Claviceps africana]
MTSSRPWRPWQLWRHDEEMAKKSDDVPGPRHLGYPAHPRTRADWTVARVRRRSWMKRLAVYALLAAALFFFFRRRGHSTSFPESYPSSRVSRGHNALARAYEGRFGSDAGDVSRPDRGSPTTKAAKKAARNRAAGKEDSARQSASKYDGPVRFPALPSTLGAISATAGSSKKNRNVLFAAASLKSVSTLLPMACEMAMERLNYVHFAFLGVADVGIKDLLEMNGIDKDCKLLTHDARPDYFESSTEHRMQLAVKSAFHHFGVYMHPQAVIVDSTTAEDDYFLAPVRDHMLSSPAALIELPDRPGKSLAWISKLDAEALSAWNKVRFDIVIRAAPAKTANLKRLLNSIAAADLAGILTPHITVEMPNTIEHSLESFLSNFKWPRQTPHGGQQPPMLSLRRRITRQPLEEEDSSVRFIESFWPTDPSSTHVLKSRLSFFNWIGDRRGEQKGLKRYADCPPDVKYTLLHTLHSKMALMEDYGASLMGFSFSIPHTLADGTTAFSPPAPQGGDKDRAGQTAFLWQQPGNEAMLFTGEKWIELHHFISRMLYQKKTMSSSSSPPALSAQKKESKKYPAWLEYVLQLSRVRGYYTMYPAKATAKAILGVHREIVEPPEEYQKDAVAEAAARKTSPTSLEEESAERFDAKSPLDMLETLSDGGNLQSPIDIPLLSWDGTLTTHVDLYRQTVDDAVSFREEFGGCKKEDRPRGTRGKKDASDLFCVKRGN